MRRSGNQPRSVDRGGAFRQLDEFLRLYQIGFVAVWPLLGLACAQAWSVRSVAGLVAAGVCFNTFGGVLNDLCDLRSDRQSVERSGRWLVTGVVSPRLATIVVSAQIPLLLGIHFAAGFRTASIGWMAAALLGQAAYDAFGKRSRVPPLAEAGQAAAASCLVFYGATCATTTLSPLVLPTAAAAAALLLLVNAFHGGLRDIHDDARSQVRTTPIWLGCTATGNTIYISPAMSAYATCWLAVLIASSLLVAHESGPVALVITLLENAVNIVLFVLLHRLEKPLWDIALRANVALLMLPIMTAFTPWLGPRASAALFAIYLAPVLPITWQFLHATAIGRRAGRPLRAA